MKSNPELQGVLVTTIPFTHPTHVPQILNFLRQQMLFNTVISSCVRPKSRKDMESALKFDIHAYSTNHIQVTFVHPLDESLAAVDLDLKEITGVKCEIHTLGMDNSLCTDDYASKIMQRCLSIPVTMRAVIRKAQGQQQQKKPEPSDLYCASVGGGTDVSYLPHMPNYGSRLANGSSLAGGHFSNLASRMCNKPMDEADLADTKSCSESVSYNLLNQESSAVEPPLTAVTDQQNVTSPTTKDLHADKIMLGSKSSDVPSFLLQSESCNTASKSANPMLMSMLNDVPSATPSSCTLSLSVKSKKRKATSDGKSSSLIGRSPKRKMCDEGSIREPLNFDAASSDSLSMSIDKSNSLPASLPSSDGESNPVVRAPASVESYMKNDPPPYNYPQRSASTDSYLSFRSQQVMNSGENSNPELSNIISQMKGSSHFVSDSDLLGSDSNLDVHNENSSIDQISFSEKINCPEKTLKKLKKVKEVSDVHEIVSSKTHDLESSEGSSSSDFFHKSSIEVENSLSEGSTPSIKTNVGNVSKPVIISTNLKIAKTTDGHKISKSELKAKQKEGRRSSDGTSGKKKSDSKKERKRKQAQTADGISNRISCHTLHCADSSLMPPPTSSSAELSSSASVCDTQPKRPITLNVKTSNSSTSGQSKSTIVGTPTSSNVANNPSKGNVLKSNGDKSSVKLSSRSSHSFALSKTVNSVRDGELSSVTKAMVSSSLKLPSKHKQTSSSKNVSSVTHSGGQSSPNKSKATTLKLKNSSLSHLSSVTVSSTLVKACPQMLPSASSVSIVTSSVDEPTSPSGKQNSSGSSKSHKSQLRSSKGTLSAVIDKLRVTATNAQQLPDNVKPNNSGTLERKDSKFERKEAMKDSKESPASKPNEGKNKYCSSDQFTVKQSSQGIKLTVTKTRFSDGSSKSGKLKSIGVKSDSSGGTVNPNKHTSGGNVAKKPTGVAQVSVKKTAHVTGMNLHSNSPHKTVRCTGSSVNPTKAVVVTGHKVISPSGAPSYHKVMSSTVNALKPNKVSTLLQQNKKKITHLNESKCASVSEASVKSSNAVNMQLKMPAPLPPAKLAQNDVCWPASNPAKLSEEQPDSQRFSTHNNIIEEADKASAFRLLLEQSKNEGQNGSEPTLPSSKTSDFVIKTISGSKIEMENKDFAVSSSTDVKRSSNIFRINQVHANISEQNIVSESQSVIAHSDATLKKHDANINAGLINSSDSINKSLPSFNMAVQSSECLNMHNEEDSSPEDGLIIDFPGTPRIPDQKRCFLSKKDKSPDQKKGRMDTIIVDKITESFEYPQSAFISKSQDQLSPSTSNHSHTLPIESLSLDDDLMNMALTMGK